MFIIYVFIVLYIVLLRFSLAPESSWMPWKVPGGDIFYKRYVSEAPGSSWKRARAAWARSEGTSGVPKGPFPLICKSRYGELMFVK